MKQQNNKITIISIISALVFLVTLFFLISSYSTIKSLVDQVPSDGNLELYTEKIDRILNRGAVIGLVFSGASFYLAVFQKERLVIWFNKFNTSVISMIKWIKSDAVILWQAFVGYLPRGKSLFGLFLIILIGIILRVLIVNRPMSHDESYTFIAFASRSFDKVITDYHLPNNHIFHTILVFFSTRLFGSDTWAVRLPALISGVLLIPAAFLVSKKIFNRQAGWLAAAAMAFFPYILLFSTDGRGYSLQALIVLLIWLLAIYLKSHRNLFGWLIFILLSSIGFYIIPTMLYPFGMVLGWFFFSWIFNDFSDKYSRPAFLKFIFLAGLGVVIITVILYIPIVTYNGIDALVGNSFIESETLISFTQIYEQVANRGVRAWKEWSTGFGDWFAVFTLVMLILAILFNKSFSREKINLLIPGVLWIALVILVQKVMPWRRIWFFLCPIYFIFSLGLVEFGLRRMIKSRLFTTILIGTIAISFLIGSVQWEVSEIRLRELLQGNPGHVEMVAEYLSTQVNQTDMIADAYSDGPTLRYYSRFHYNISPDHFDITKGPFERVFFIVQPAAGQTIDGIIQIRGSALTNSIDLDQLELVYSTGKFEIFLAEIIQEQ